MFNLGKLKKRFILSRLQSVIAHMDCVVASLP